MALPHTYILGSSGTGKSTHQKQLAIDHLSAGGGLLYLDPHGEDATDLLNYIPQKRRKDVILFDDLPWNPLADASPDDYPLIASTFVDTIRTISKLTGGGTAVMDMYVYASVVTMLETQGSLTDIPRLLRDKDYLTAIADTLKDGPIKDFWTQFLDLSGKEREQQVASTYNKFFQLNADPRIRRILNQPKSAFTLSDVLENNKILIVRLPQGKLGIGKTGLLGSLLLSQAHVAALSRRSRERFLFILDEVHLWAPSIVAELLSGVRKFGVSLVCSHQYVRQLPEDLFDAFMGNCERHVFRVSEEDALRFQRRFSAQDTAQNLDELPDFTYRIFPWRKGDRDVTLPDMPVPFERSRTDIEARMRTDF